MNSLAASIHIALNLIEKFDGDLVRNGRFCSHAPRSLPS